jgi:hypothetical protein
VTSKGQAISFVYRRFIGVADATAQRDLPISRNQRLNGEGGFQLEKISPETLACRGGRSHEMPQAAQENLLGYQRATETARAKQNDNYAVSQRR